MPNGAPARGGKRGTLEGVQDDFQLADGSLVNARTLRAGIVARAGGILSDVVICGRDKSYLSILAWPSVAGCRELAGGDMTMDALSVAEVVREHVRDTLRAWNKENSGPTAQIKRALLLGDPPSTGGEIDAEGNVDPLAVSERRASAIADLYAEPLTAGVITV